MEGEGDYTGRGVKVAVERERELTVVMEKVVECAEEEGWKDGSREGGRLVQLVKEERQR